MYTIYDYLKYYKDYSLSEEKWNIMDNLLCSILAYTPIKNFTISKDLNTFYNEITIQETKKHIMEYNAIELLKIIKDSKRYKNIKFSNFINIIDNKTQFGVFTMTIDNIKVISFKGTDDSLIGWLENFRLAYMYPTYTQKQAIEYLNKNISIFDSEVYVTGHSKGGNLAMASVMELNDIKYSKVKNVTNFDGPGFRIQEYNSEKYKKLSKKLINIVPDNSYIGTLLFNDNYQVIKTNSHAINVHYPIYWNTYGINFIESKLSKMSEELHERTSENIKNVDEEIIKEVSEKIFENLNYKTTKRISINLNDIMHVLKTIKGIDNKTLKYISNVISSMLSLSHKS